MKRIMISDIKQPMNQFTVSQLFLEFFVLRFFNFRLSISKYLHRLRAFITKKNELKIVNWLFDSVNPSNSSKNKKLFPMPKCQLISKDFLKFSFAPKNERKYFCISALASKKRSNQKNKGTFTTNWRILF